MAEETKQAIAAICDKISSGKVVQQAVEIAIDLHEAAKAEEKEEHENA